MSRPSAASTAPSLQPSTRGIDLGGWSIKVTSGPIGSSAEMDALSDVLGIPPPEMAFPHNCLTLVHHASGFRLCFDAVRTLRSVDGVDPKNWLPGIDCRDTAWADGKPKASGAGIHSEKPKPRNKSSIKVAYAKEWGKSRNDTLPATAPSTATLSTASADSPTRANSTSNSNSNLGASAAATMSSSTSSLSSTSTGASGSHFGGDIAKKAVAASQTSDISAAKDYDWTYSTTWAGAVGEAAPQVLLPQPDDASASSSDRDNARSWFVRGTDPALDRIPVERLGPSSGEPILFYDDIVLFEDELADNGSSMVSVKVRVMPSGFLVLQRFFLRVDDVVFRTFDTRIYCAFTDEELALQEGHGKRGTKSALGSDSKGSHDRLEHQDLSKLSLGATRSAVRRSAGSKNASEMQIDSPATPTPSQSQPIQAQAQAQVQAQAPRLIRECSGSEASYAEVKSHLPPYKAHDLSPLTDPNWVSDVLSRISRVRLEQFHARVALGQSVVHPSTGLGVSASAGASAALATSISPSVQGLRSTQGRSSVEPTRSGVFGTLTAPAGTAGMAGSARTCFPGPGPGPGAPRPTYLAPTTGFAGCRPGEQLDLSPATATATAPYPSARATSNPTRSGFEPEFESDFDSDSDADAMQQARILGTVEENASLGPGGGAGRDREQETWLGCGARVDVALLYPAFSPSSSFDASFNPDSNSNTR
ncbi:hypothetical protein BCV70DRAFT_197535 [Testicularia cyperi]|uniref:TIP41-domain-containing protein n=1 Tax=Testicularia cyperi TaxID=1882483 RepID=A0A317XYV8_9BASI|nr:hypothetical protein BCV70DRAFT_197535 [Testicularia cyperi]